MPCCYIQPTPPTEFGSLISSVIVLSSLGAGFAILREPNPILRQKSALHSEVGFGVVTGESLVESPRGVA